MDGGPSRLRDFHHALKARICVLTVIALVAPAQVLAAEAGFYADNPQDWHNFTDPTLSEASIPTGGSVTFENRDTTTASGHSVRCIQAESNNSCPWSDTKSLPRPTGTVTGVTVTFLAPGTYAFQCGVHPEDMRGRVVVGAGVPSPSPRPSPSPSPSSSPSPSPSPLPIPESTNLAPEFRESGSIEPEDSRITETALDAESRDRPHPIWLAIAIVLLLVTAVIACIYFILRWRRLVP